MVTEPWISCKSTKSCAVHKTCKIQQNSLEIIPNTCWYNIFETYPGCWGCLLAVKLRIYCETLPFTAITASQITTYQKPSTKRQIKNWLISDHNFCFTFSWNLNLIEFEFLDNESAILCLLFHQQFSFLHLFSDSCFSFFFFLLLKQIINQQNNQTPHNKKSIINANNI